MHNSHYDELFFPSKYVAGLKDDIRATVEPHVPLTVDRAALITMIQQRTLDRHKNKYNRLHNVTKPQFQKGESITPATNPNLQRIRQLRDYRRANNLCFACGEKFEPGHQDVCSKRQKPQLNAIVVNELDRDKEEITEDMLNQLAIEDALADNFYQLSLNALSGNDHDNSMKLKSMVKDKVMLILLDSGSSYSFISSNFVALANLHPTPILAKIVRLANGECLTATTSVSKLQWYIQRHTLTSDMIVLDMGPYDAILGYDWLRENSPMQFDWSKKTIQFSVDEKQVKL